MHTSKAIAYQLLVPFFRPPMTEAEALATHRQRLVEQLGRLYAPLGLLVVAADEPHRDARSGSGIQIDDQPWPSR